MNSTISTIEFETGQAVGYVVCSVGVNEIHVTEYSVEIRSDLHDEIGNHFTEGFIFGILAHFSLPVVIDQGADIWT